MRGLAALVVMLFHFRWNINLSFPGVGDKLFGWGAIGVDLFFIISGFVIVLSVRKYEPGLPAFLNFLKHRALRIFPIYYLILIISFFLSGAMSTFHYEDKTANFISALLFQPILPHNPPFYIEDDALYNIRWTLNYELAFYALMSVCLFTKHRWALLFAFFAVLQVLIPAVTGQNLTLSTVGYKFESVYIQLLTNPIMLTFIPGALIGIFYSRLNAIPVKAKRLILLIAICSTVFFIFIENRAWHGMAGSGLYLSLLFLSFVINDDLITKISPTCLIKLGDISFSLYLIHVLMNNGIGKRFLKMGIEDGIPRFIISVVLSILLAWISYRFVEAKIMISKKKK